MNTLKIINAQPIFLILLAILKSQQNNSQYNFIDSTHHPTTIAHTGSLSSNSHGNGKNAGITISYYNIILYQ